MIKRIGKYFCVCHGHPIDPRIPNDKPIGTPIKCFSISKYGYQEAYKKAFGLHTILDAKHKALIRKLEAENNKTKQRS